MTSRRYQSLLQLLGIAFFIYVVMLAVFSQPGFPESMRSDHLFPYLSDKPVGEDGYYMLTVAWNLASGAGMSYNQSQITTGVQPLSTILEAAVTWVIQQSGGDKWTLVRAIQLLGAAYLFIFAFLVKRLTAFLIPERSNYGELALSIAFLITLFNFGLFRIFTYGLETGIYLILVATNLLFTLVVIKKGHFSVSTAAVFGVLAGLTFLARIDFILILGGFLILAILRRSINLLQAGVTSLVALAVASPWFIFVYSHTGNLLPSSGFAQAGWVTSAQIVMRLWEMIRSLISHAIPLIYSRPNALLTWLGVVLLGILIIFTFSRHESRLLVHTIFSQQPAYLDWFIAILILVPVYLIGFNAIHFYTRYTAPIEVVLIPLLSIILADWLIATSLKLQYVFLLLIPICFFLWAGITLHTGAVTNTQAVAAGFIANNFPAPVKVGAFQSGVMGYFNPNVINLDGKVNQEALNAQREGRLINYLDEQEILVLIDWPEVIQKKLPSDYLKNEWQPCQDTIPDNRTVCFERREP